MLGKSVADPACLESHHRSTAGLSLLPIRTDLRDSKRLVRVCGRVRDHLPGIWSKLSGATIEGYEIHMGRTTGAVHRALLYLECGPDGAVSADGLVAGTYVHGMLEPPEPRHALLRALARSRGFAWNPDASSQTDPYDVLADALEETLDLRGCCVSLSVVP